MIAWAQTVPWGHTIDQSPLRIPEWVRPHWLSSEARGHMGWLVYLRLWTEVSCHNRRDLKLVLMAVCHHGWRQSVIFWLVRPNFTLVLQRKRGLEECAQRSKASGGDADRSPVFWDQLEQKDACVGTAFKIRRRVTFHRPSKCFQVLAFILWTWCSNLIRHKAGLPILRCHHLSPPWFSCNFPSLPDRETPLPSCSMSYRSDPPDWWAPRPLPSPPHSQFCKPTLSPP